MIKINLDFLAGAAVGFGAGVFSRELTPVVKDSVRPVAKVTLKAGIASYQKAVETFSELRESIEDLVAEARHEAHGEPLPSEDETPGKPDLKEAV